MVTAVALLFPEQVAEIWTEERRKAEGPGAAAVKPDRVYDFLRWSKPAPAGKAKNRYQDSPMPYPRGTRGARQPGWHADQEQDLRDWWNVDRFPPDWWSGSADRSRDENRIDARRSEWAEARAKK